MSVKELIKAKSQPVIVPVEIDGETFYLRRLQGRDIEPNVKNLTKYLVFASLCEADGEQVFAKQGDVDDVDLRLINRLAKHALDLNGLSDESFPNANEG